MRVLVVSNMGPEQAHPERGRFVRDQVRALSMLADVEAELVELQPGARALATGFGELRRRGRTAAFDVVHAHFSLTALPAFAAPARLRGLTLHGTDVVHPRTRQITRALLPAIDLIVAVSSDLAKRLPSAAARRRAQVIPCGVDVERFDAIDRAEARRALGLPPQQPLLLFPADPSRPAKRHDLASSLAEAARVRLLSLGGVDPERVPLYVNAASAVVVPSDAEGFGLAVLEALACDVPVLATPVGVHPQALAGIEGTLCAPFELTTWLPAVESRLQDDDPRVDGRERALSYSAQAMAERLAQAWRDALARRATGKPPARTG